MDTSTICPFCLQENAVNEGYCRFCKKSVAVSLPVGVLPPGTVLNGRYLTGMFLGKGGFGTIYKALDLVSNKVVAIKEYYPVAWCDRQACSNGILVTHPEEYEYGLKHFKGETEILRKIQGVAEVVRLYNEFNENNTAYYVMEFLEGETLQSYLKSHKEKLSYSAAVTLLMPVILGMNKVHRTGTTHRDISPDNIFLCSDGSVRIIDFGASASRSSNLSRSFIPVEKEGYSPPEQHTISTHGDTQGTWSDVYAMAGTLYRCAVGIRPPSASARQAGDNLDFSRAGLTRDQIRVLEKNLSLKAEARCQNMLQFAGELLGAMKTAEANSLRASYPELADPVSNEPPSNPSGFKSAPLSVPQSKSDMLIRRRVLAYISDMFFFQAVPAALNQLAGGSLFMWLLGGYVIGVLTTSLMTISAARGGPGETLFGLEVICSRISPSKKEPFIYCLIRCAWPLKPIEGIYYLATKKNLNYELSGCSSCLKGAACHPGGQLMLKIIEGFYQGSTIPIEAGRYVIGRNPERCNLVYPMIYNVVSRVHMDLTLDDAGNIFVTNRSSHGTWVGNRLLGANEEVKASIGTTIAFGKEKLIITTN